MCQRGMAQGTCEDPASPSLEVVPARLVMKSPTGDVTFGIASDCSVMTQQAGTKMIYRGSPVCFCDVVQGSPTQAAALSVINPKEHVQLVALMSWLSMALPD